MENETRKHDELAGMLEHLAGVLETQADRLAALERRSMALEELAIKHTDALVAQQEHYRVIAEVLASHKVCIEDMQKVLARASSAPAGPPPRVVN